MDEWLTAVPKGETDLSFQADDGRVPSGQPASGGPCMCVNSCEPPFGCGRAIAETAREANRTASSILVMRDFLQAIHSRVVVYDGGMGATLEQFDLTPEDYGGLQGKCHEALVLNRPDVIEGVHASMLEAGAEVLETDTFQASRLKLGEWGLADYTRGDQHQGRRNRAQGRRRAPLRRRLDRPHRLPARLRGPLARTDPLRRAGRGVRRAGGRPDRRRRRPDHHRDRAGHPRGQGRGVRGARGVQDHRAYAADPHLGVAAAQRRQDAARHRHLRGADHAGGAEGRRDRTELLDRTGGHARRDPLPRRVLPGARGVHPQRRTTAAGPGRRDDLPREARAAGGGAEGVRRALRRGDRRRLLRHDPRAHRRDRRARREAAGSAEASQAGPSFLLDDRRNPARTGAGADDGGRARQLAGLAQGQGAAAGRRLRRARADRRGPGDRRRACARPVRGADRAHRRGRTDAAGGEEGVADPARADPDRLDRAGGDRTRAGADPRPRDRQLGQPRGRPRQARPRRARRTRARRGADRADDRRGRDGEDGRAQGRDRQAHPRAVLRGAWPRPAAVDLRLPDVHADDRR